MRETILLVTMWIVTVCTYISYVPQIVKVIRTKSSEDLSIASWVLWLLSAICNSIYSIVLLRPELIIASVSEFLLIAVTLVLSLIYKNKRKFTVLGVELESKEDYGYYLLQTIAGNYFANKEVIEAIAEHCTSEGVLLNIVSNKDIPKEIRDKASKRISDIKYWYLF